MTKSLSRVDPSSDGSPESDLHNPYGPQDQLDPPNEKPHIVLPPSTVSVHRSPSATGAILKVYPEALAFVDQLAVVRGYLAANGLIGLPLTVLFLANLWGDGRWILAAVTLIIALVLLAFVQIDFVGFRYAPVLVDRRLNRVHVFVPHMLPWWQWFWKLWGRSGWEVQSYDWDCIRAEVVQFTIFSGQIPRRESALVFAVTESPGNTKVIQRFGVGPTSAYGEMDSLLRRWEHIRRFMEERGPAWAKGDAKFSDFGIDFWDAATFMQPLFNPVFADLREGGGHWWIWPLGILALVGLPLTVPLGMVRWLSHRANAEPVWPRDVVASLGSELSDADLDREIARASGTAGKAKRRRLES
jgi:hypothetical protein